MRVVFILHGYPPFHNAGAETYAHNLNLWLKARGHDVLALTRDSAVDWQGITVRKRAAMRRVDAIVNEADLIITHLDETRIAEAAAARAGKPIAHVLHNDRQLQFHKVQKADLIISNSRWIVDRIPQRLRQAPTVVLYPPTFLNGLPTESPDREAITLVNMLEAKGARVFYYLAARFPERPFLAVTGAYGAQMPVPAGLENVRVRPNRVDMGPVWEATRLYIQPSEYESWGKAAVEAMAHGIPVIAHPTAGLLESLGDAGIFIDREEGEKWVQAVEALDDPKAYKHQAELVRARATELEAITYKQLEALEEAMLKVVAG